ncbi:hypothetical protein CSC62_14160 [Pseudoxanthomonas jiangsuensis]|nr:hypothetical protein CSC62_14160 [Pseudoxanthomonas jiangsuensis]
MRLLIARTHPGTEYEAAAGMPHEGPGGHGDQSYSWGIEPGRFPGLLYRAQWGKPVRGSLEWRAGRPILWDVDLAQAAPTEAVAVLASGFHLVSTRRPWRYYEPPGGELMFLAGLGSGRDFSVLARHNPDGGFPVVLPPERVLDWVMGGPPGLDGLAALPSLGPELFRSWPVADPTLIEDGPERLRPLLEGP